VRHVQTVAETVAAAVTYTYTIDDTPTVSSVNPRWGTALGGETITITGTKFSADLFDMDVEVNGGKCEVTAVNTDDSDANTLECTTPARGTICPPYVLFLACIAVFPKVALSFYKLAEATQLVKHAFGIAKLGWLVSCGK
jgi:hypothetical protein